MQVLAPRRQHVVAFVSFAAAAAAFVSVPLTSDANNDADAAPVELKIATFNIEFYPQHERQSMLAFQTIRALDVPLVAVQEIKDVAHFSMTAKQRLGDEWRFVAVNHRLATGLLYDSDRYGLISLHTHESTVIAPGLIPVFEVRLTPRDARGSHDAVRVYVVHWKAGGENFATRNKQMDALAPILDAARRSGDRIVVLGDFNATGLADRERIAQLAKDARVAWATPGLGCTCFWQREEDCVGSALDHVLTSERVASVGVRGACAEGCPTTDRCPAWRDEVSDHCPVVVTMSSKLDSE